MSDINDPIPFINYGEQEAQIPNTNASTNLMGSQAGLVQQQTQQAAMATAIQRASMPMIMQTMREAYADQSGSNPGNPQAGVAALPNGVPPGMTNAATGQIPYYAGPAGTGGPTADVSGTAATGGMEDQFRAQNYVQPYTSQELNMVRMGTMMSFNPNTAAAGTALVERAKTQALMRTTNQTALNQLRSGNIYDAVKGIADPDNLPHAMQMLSQVSPPAATALQAQADRDGSDPNQLAQDYAGHLAAVSHLYSGRPTHSENGQLIDDKTGQPVVGQAQTYTGMTTEQRQKTADTWNAEWKWTTPDGRDHVDARWRAPSAYGGLDGKINPYQATLIADQAMRQRTPGTPGATTAPGNAPNAAAPSAGGGAFGASAAELDNIVHEAGAANPTGPAIHGAVAAQRVATKSATAAPPTAATAPGTGTANSGLNAAAGTGGATAQDTGLLPGLNPASLPKAVSPVDTGQGGPSIQSKSLQAGMAERTNTAYAATTESINNAKQARTLINQANQEVSHLDPRVVGPGSTLYQGALKFYTAAAGQAPDALVDETVLDKFLNQLGANNVRQLLAGQKITNQEMMTFLTRGSPSTSMPLGGIQHLLKYLDADNEYTLRYNRTKQIALKQGADPDLIDGAMDPNGLRRANFINSRTGGGPTLGATSGTSTPGAATVRVVHPNGQTGTIPAAQLQAALAAGYKQVQ